MLISLFAKASMAESTGRNGRRCERDAYITAGILVNQYAGSGSVNTGELCSYAYFPALPAHVIYSMAIRMNYNHQ